MENNTILLQMIAKQYGFGLESIVNSQYVLTLFTQLSRLYELYKKYLHNHSSNNLCSDDNLSVTDKMKAAHAQLVQFCDTNRITLSDDWRNVALSVQEQVARTVQIEDGYLFVADKIDQSALANMCAPLPSLLLIIKASFQVFFWTQYVSVHHAIQRLMQLADNFSELQNLTRIFCENAAKLSERTEKINGLLKQFYAKVDLKSKQELLEQIQLELLDAKENEFAKTRQEYDRLETKLKSQLKWSIRKQNITNAAKWASYIAAGALAAGTVIAVDQSIQNNQGIGRLGPGMFVAGCATGYLGYGVFRFEAQREKECKLLLCAQIQQLKDVRKNFIEFMMNPVRWLENVNILRLIIKIALIEQNVMNFLFRKMESILNRFRNLPPLPPYIQFGGFSNNFNFQDLQPRTKKILIALLSLFVFFFLFYFCSKFILAKPTQTETEFRLSEIRTMAKEAWSAYYQYALGYDALKPLTKTGYSHPVYANTGPSVLSAASTLWIMNLTVEFEQAQRWIQDNFALRCASKILNELVDEIIGALMSAYALTGNRMFLDLAKDIMQECGRISDLKPDDYMYLSTKLEIQFLVDLVGPQILGWNGYQWIQAMKQGNDSLKNHEGDCSISQRDDPFLKRSIQNETIWKQRFAHRIEGIEYYESLSQICYEKAHGYRTKLPTAVSENLRNFGEIKPDQGYHLGPELAENYFMMWRLTHELEYREHAWELVQSIQKYCRVENGGGFAGVKNVDQIPVEQLDLQNPIFLSATLKYLYLTFTEDSILDLEQWQFNQVGHPLPYCGHNAVYPKCTKPVNA